MKSAVFRGLGLILAAMVLLLPLCPAQAGEETHVVILLTSDIHADLWGYDYESGTETDNTGLARLYTYISAVREENPIVFLIDAGDSIQGTPLTDEIANLAPENEHPVMAAMNEMGFDAMTLGNHEFNWGIDTMLTILSQADFPVLGANVLNQDGSYLTGRGWTMIERGGVKLAVIGVCTPDIPIWDGDQPGVSETVFEAANTAVTKALEEIGDSADIILVSAHMGEFAEFDEDGGSDSGRKILDDNPQVDILQLGHMHITVNHAYKGIPMVAVRNRGREIARIDVTLDTSGITNIETAIIDMAGVEPGKAIREIPIVKKLHEQALTLARDPADDKNVPDEVIGTAAADFLPENEIAGLPEGRIQDTALMDLILTVQLASSGADVTAAPLFKDHADLDEGDILYSELLEIYPYDNTLYMLNVTGAELKGYMEWAAECYNQWQEGDINISFDIEHPGYLYDMFAGVDYEINLSKPAGERIENVLFRGEPLQDDQVLTLAVNNYRYSAAIKAFGLAEGNRFWESDIPIRDMIKNYISSNSPVTPFADGNWRITGIDLAEDDPRRAEIIGLINNGALEAPCYKSYNLKDYDALVSGAADEEALEPLQ